jgi:hypothetical protein
MSRIAVLLSILILAMSLAMSASCAGSDRDFGIYLADSGERVLSLKDIKAYHSLDCSLELNAEGIERWNSFQTYTAEPKLAQGLYHRDFIIKIDGDEICRGKFYSLVSSASYDGVVILDSIIKLDGENNSIKIEFGYAASVSDSEESRIKSELESFFGGKGMLVADVGWWMG